MKKAGFTLVELLAVIIVLAIIALIAVPIVLNVINDAKESSIEKSIKLYIKAIDNSIANQKTLDPSFDPKECIIKENKEIECDGTTISIDAKGSVPNSGTIIITDGKISYRNLFFNDKYYHQILEKNLENTSESINPICKPKKNISLDLGTEYECEVKENTKFNFYVLSEEENNVNLIMDSNICLDGSNNYTSGNNYCRYAWYETSQNNSYGPITAMTNLYEATKEWNNVSNIIMDYDDEENHYKKIKVTDTKMEIIPNSGTSYIKNFDSEKPLRARMPKYSEMLSTDCKISNTSTNDYSGLASCPVWIMKNIKYLNDADIIGYEKYISNETNNLSETNHIHGFWLISSATGPGVAYVIREEGYISKSSGVEANQIWGIRPVITIPKYNLID